LSEVLFQIAALAELGDHINIVLGKERVIKFDNVRMIEPLKKFNFQVHRVLEKGVLLKQAEINLLNSNPTPIPSSALIDLAKSPLTKAEPGIVSILAHLTLSIHL
jgi:hypothetical protein